MTAFEVRLDSAFDRTMAECAAPRPGQVGTWITDAMRVCYAEMHELGLAHSVEVWRAGALIGGLYGVALGRMFFGESMFARATDASKIALGNARSAAADRGSAGDRLPATYGAPRVPGCSRISRDAFCRHVEEATQLEPVPWSRYRGTNLLERFDS